MLHEESGFDADEWQGLPALGYAEHTRVRWSLPAWYPFRGLPLGDLAEQDLIVFQRVATAPSAHAAR